MGKPPPIKPGDDFYFGQSFIPRSAVVARVYDSGDRVEAVYFDNKDQPIAEDFEWDGERWTFVDPGPCGLYAERHGRFAPYVAALYHLNPEKRRRRR